MSLRTVVATVCILVAGVIGVHAQPTAPIAKRHKIISQESRKPGHVTKAVTDICANDKMWPVAIWYEEPLQKLFIAFEKLPPKLEKLPPQTCGVFAAHGLGPDLNDNKLALDLDNLEERWYFLGAFGYWDETSQPKKYYRYILSMCRTPDGCP